MMRLFNLTQLKILNLGGNQLATLTASQNVRFKSDIEINLAENYISKLEENALASFHRLASLNLDMNNVSV